MENVEKWFLSHTRSLYEPLQGTHLLNFQLLFTQYTVEELKLLHHSQFTPMETSNNNNNNNHNNSVIL